MRIVPELSNASTFLGFWFVFSNEEQKIALWASSITGKQCVYVDGELVSSVRSLLVQSRHTFSVCGDEYEIEVAIEKLKRGVFRCTLKRNGFAVDAYVTEYHGKTSAFAYFLLHLVIASFVFACFVNQTAYWLGTVALTAVWLGLVYWPKEGKGYTIARVSKSALETGGGSGND